MNERERLQEAHEQKMHFLHEFHRQQLHAKDHEINAREHQLSAREMERRAREAEERAERMARSVLEGRFRAPVVEGQAGMKEDKVDKGGAAPGDQSGNEEKEREVWRWMESAREDVDDDNSGQPTRQGDEGSGAGVVEEVGKNRYQ